MVICILNVDRPAACKKYVVGALNLAIACDCVRERARIKKEKNIYISMYRLPCPYIPAILFRELKRSLKSIDASAPRNANRGNVIETLCVENRIGDGGRFLIHRGKDQSVFVSSAQRRRENSRDLAPPPILFSSSSPSISLKYRYSNLSGAGFISEHAREAVKPESKIEERQRREA